MYTNRIAKVIAVILTPFEAASAPKRPSVPVTISRAQAKATRDTMVAAAPAIMKGLRFPHDDRQLSLIIPTYGWTSVPESGPAIQTSASNDLLMPKDKR